MHRISRSLAFVLQFVTIGLALAFVISLLWPAAGRNLRQRLGLQAPARATSRASLTPPAVSEPAAPAVASYADAVERAAPAVVSIYANKVVTERRVRVYPDPLMQRLFGGIAFGPAYQRPEQSLGSGVIMGSEGYVLTNNHVIAGANDIKVLLYDNRVASAKVVGTDAETDLAVLKIDASNLPSITIAEDAPLKVGDVVLAIGNPFGFLSQTVTMGIVSGLQRQLSASSYENFIQTDAAINDGNSGGALINAHGELVGINTAILGRRAGAEGIGFAIPVGTAKVVMDQIISHGMVVRGWIGADYRAVTADINSGQPTPSHGVLVVNVYPTSPAAQAGLQPGDILLSMNGKPIPGPSYLLAHEASMKPGTEVSLAGVRNGSPLKLTLTLAQRPSSSRPRGPIAAESSAEAAAPFALQRAAAAALACAGAAARPPSAAR